MQKYNKKTVFIRLDKETAEALETLVSGTKRNQADAVRYAIRYTVTQAIRTQKTANALDSLLPVL